MRLGFVIGVVMLGGAAVAAPRVAVHPLVVLGGELHAAEQSRADFIGEAALQPIQMVSRGQVAEVLATQPGQACGPKTEGCLEILCRETGAAYALLATLMLDGPNFVLGGKVVSADGTFAKAVEPLTIAKDLFSPRGPQVQAAFKKLFSQLDLGALPEQAPPRPALVGEVKPAPPPPPVVEAPVAPTVRRGTPPARIAGLVVGGVAVVVAGLATGFAYSASSDSALLRQTLDTNGLLPRENLDRAKAIDSKTLIASGLFVAAGVVAATSVALVLLSLDSGAPRVGLAPIEGGAMVGLGGSF